MFVTALVIRGSVSPVIASTVSCRILMSTFVRRAVLAVRGIHRGAPLRRRLGATLNDARR